MERSNVTGFVEYRRRRFNVACSTSFPNAKLSRLSTEFRRLVPASIQRFLNMSVCTSVGLYSQVVLATACCVSICCVLYSWRRRKLDSASAAAAAPWLPEHLGAASTNSQTFAVTHSTQSPAYFWQPQQQQQQRNRPSRERRLVTVSACILNTSPVYPLTCDICWSVFKATVVFRAVFTGGGCYGFNPLNCWEENFLAMKCDARKSHLAFIKCKKPLGRPGLRPGPRLESLQRSPDPLADGEGAGCPFSQESHSRSRPFRPRLSPPPNFKPLRITILATALVVLVG